MREEVPEQGSLPLASKTSGLRCFVFRKFGANVLSPRFRFPIEVRD